LESPYCARATGAVRKTEILAALSLEALNSSLKENIQKHAYFQIPSTSRKKDNSSTSGIRK
jgi:hypothetical protein